MEIIKLLLLLLLSLIYGFGVWYLIFWFVSAESNLFIWGPWTKVFYMFFGLILSNKILKETTK
jgi:hypothetical protein